MERTCRTESRGGGRGLVRVLGQLLRGVALEQVELEGGLPVPSLAGTEVAHYSTQ